MSPGPPPAADSHVSHGAALLPIQVRPGLGTARVQPGLGSHSMAGTRTGPVTGKVPGTQAGSARDGPLWQLRLLLRSPSHAFKFRVMVMPSDCDEKGVDAAPAGCFQAQAVRNQS